MATGGLRLAMIAACQQAIQFDVDFGSPNAYLCHKVIPAVQARSGASFSDVPVLLGGIFKLTGNQSPATAFAGLNTPQTLKTPQPTPQVARASLRHPGAAWGPRCFHFAMVF